MLVTKGGRNTWDDYPIIQIGELFNLRTSKFFFSKFKTTLGTHRGIGA